MKHFKQFVNEGFVDTIKTTLTTIGIIRQFLALKAKYKAKTKAVDKAWKHIIIFTLPDSSRNNAFIKEVEAIRAKGKPVFKLFTQQDNVVEIEFIYGDPMFKEDTDDQVKGGKADKHTPESIAKKHNVSVENIKKQIAMGIIIEREHTNDDAKAKEIAMDHLAEFPDYYTKLKKMEKEAEK